MSATRIGLLVLQAFLGLLGTLFGVGLALASSSTRLTSDLIPDAEHLAGSPFDSYLLPGILLVVLVGAPHLVAFVHGWRRRARAERRAVGGVDLGAAALALVGVAMQQTFAPGIFPARVVPWLVGATGGAELLLVVVGAVIARRAARP